MSTMVKVALLAFLMFSMNVGPSFGDVPLPETHSLLISHSITDGVPDNYGLCGSGYSTMYTELTSRFEEVLCAPDLEDLDLLLHYNALWLELRSVSGSSNTSGSLTDSEISNIGAFMEKGGKVVMIGEWGWEKLSQINPIRYEAWDNQILGIVGGTYAGAYSGTISSYNPHSITANDITQGVYFLDLYRNNYGTANGGIPLFWPAIANLWGIKKNVLTILDSGFYDDNHWLGEDNAIFAHNVAEWLSTPVLELDTTPPTITSASANPQVLWPPNQKMVDVTIVANASDNSGRPVALTAVVSSNEPQDDAAGDWTQPKIDQNTGIISLQLLADRSGKGSGRVYTITITATDSSGNSSTADVKIIVPHDQSKK